MYIGVTGSGLPLVNTKYLCMFIIQCSVTFKYLSWCRKWAMAWVTEESGFDSWQGQKIFFLYTGSRLVLGFIWCVSGASFSKGKSLGPEAHHSASCSAENKNAWSYETFFATEYGSAYCIFRRSRFKYFPGDWLPWLKSSRFSFVFSGKWSGSIK